MTAAVFTELRSPRLVLRRLCPSDLDALCAYRSLPEVARFQSWESFGREDAAQLIAEQSQREPNTPVTWFQLAIVVAESGMMIGDLGLHFPLGDSHQVEFGITLGPAHQGHGFATEALDTVLGYLFGELDKHRVSAITDAENKAATSLLLRAGFRQEGHFLENVWFKGTWGSEYAFALLRREWAARRRRRSD